MISVDVKANVKAQETNRLVAGFRYGFFYLKDKVSKKHGKSYLMTGP